jgi:predicted nucleic acid-binding protein
MTVVDAGVVLRLLGGRSEHADVVIRRSDLVAPALITAETANGLAKEVRFAGLDVRAAAALMRDALALPIELVPDSTLAVDALQFAKELDLSAYDAMYVALAERLGAPLVTADRRLAERYPRSELIP